MSLLEQQQLLYATLLSFHDIDDIHQFMTDLCTAKELSLMADRLQVAKLVSQGKSYRDIYRLTGVSPTTIARVAKTLQQNGHGYRLVLEKNDGGVINKEDKS